MKDRTVSQAELGKLLGITTRQIRNLREAGMPAEIVKGRHPRFYIPESIQWYVKHKSELAADRARPHDVQEARYRLEAAKAEVEELKLAEMRRELLTVTEAEAELAAAFGRVRSRLLNLAHKAALHITGSTLPERTTQAQHLVDEVLAELYAAADVPE